MLNIKEIMRFMESNPEPEEVTNIREKILSTFNKLQFVEESHQYFLPNSKGELIEYDCVSHITHQFVPPTDWEQVAENYAIKHGRTKEDVQEEWHYNNIKATNSGTGTHLYGEQWMELFLGNPDNICEVIKPQFQDGYLLPHSPKEEAVAKFNEDLFRTPNMYPVLAETKVYTGINNLYSLKTNYAGTFDILYYFKHPTDSNKSGLLILDYKGLPLDTPILTNNGWVNIGDLKEGDTIFDKEGKKTNILHKSQVHFNKCYKIRFDNNDSIIADYEHRWLISFNKQKSVNGKIINTFEDKIMTTEEIKKYLIEINSLPKNKKHSYLLPKILINKPLEGEKKDLPIDPYVLGLWLGDGSKSCGILTNMYDEIWDEVIRRGYEIGKDVSGGSSGKAKSRTIFKLSTELKKLNLIKNKHIPSIYLLASYEQRLDLLRGLMDADGYYNPKRKRYVMSTTNVNQSIYMTQLLSSLGIKVSNIKTKRKCTNSKNKKLFNAIDICFTTEIYPFLMRNIEVKYSKDKRHMFRNIIDIEEVETVPTCCIEVDSPSHTFLAGYNMIVTHNTNHELYNKYNIENNKTLLLPFNNMINQNLSLYTLQLSCYQIPLEDIGLKVLGRRIIWLKPDGNYEKIPVPDVTKQLRNIL